MASTAENLVLATPSRTTTNEPSASASPSAPGSPASRSMARPARDCSPAYIMSGSRSCSTTNRAAPLHITHLAS